MFDWVKEIWLWYLRVVSYFILVALGLAQRLYRCLKPLLAPLIVIVDDIDRDDVSITSINTQLLESVFSFGILSWKTVKVVLDVILKPFGKYVNELIELAKEIKKDFENLTSPQQKEISAPSGGVRQSEPKYGEKDLELDEKSVDEMLEARPQVKDD